MPEGSETHQNTAAEVQEEVTGPEPEGREDGQEETNYEHFRRPEDSVADLGA